ncbi:MAG: hypothetical protein FWC79_03180 [Oscillospiraceae bacterium]|nr:hypothetical protein [Oscillospiraceae bacterium]
MSFKIPSGVNKVPFSIRVDEEYYNIIVDIAKKNNKSHNFVINEMIKYSIENMDIKDTKR